MVDNALFSNANSGGTDNWSTPTDLYDWLCARFKVFRFYLDPCADENNRRGDLFYNEEMNGLSKTWDYTSVFCNPPYSQIQQWMQKGYEENLKRTKPGVTVFLVPARTDTRWWHSYAAKASCIIFLKGRVKFGNAKNGAPFPSAIVVFDNSKTEQKVTFESYK